MAADDIVKLLPPILLGFGGVIPLLIATNPFPVRPHLKPLLAVMFILVVWASYLTGYMLFTHFIYEYWITIGLIVVSMVILGIVYFALHPAELAAGASPPPAPAWAFPLYAAAVAILSAAAANYVGPTGHVVVDLRVLDVASGKKLAIKEIRFSEGVNEYPLLANHSGDHSALILEKKLFGKIKALSARFDTPVHGEQRISIDPKHLQFVLHPSLLERYWGQLEYHGP